MILLTLLYHEALSKSRKNSKNLWHFDGFCGKIYLLLQADVRFFQNTRCACKLLTGGIFVKKPSRVLALVLVFEMVMSLLSVMSFGTEEGEQARQIEGLPSDGSYGVVCYCGETPAAVLGADISDGAAPVRTVRLSPDGKTIAFLPAGAYPVHKQR